MSSTSTHARDPVHQDAGSRCVSAAVQIAKLLRLYKMQHSLKRINLQAVHIIFTAALVLIHDVCVRPHVESRQSLQELQFCCHALGEIGQYYGSATRALETIILVKSEWQRLASARRIEQSRLKRASVSVSESQSGTTNGHGVRRKRRNTNTISREGHLDMSMFSTPTLYPPVFDPGYYLGSQGGLSAQTEDLLAFNTLPGIAEPSPGFDDLVNGSWFDLQQSISNGDINLDLDEDDQHHPGLNQGRFSLI